jgi:MAF protein
MNTASRRAIVLASRSPRRRALAEAEGWDVTVMPAAESVEAGQPSRREDETLEAYVSRLALAKARAVAASVVTGTLLACDTLSEVDGTALGQPIDREDARRMLLALAGRRHRVVSAVCLWKLPGTAPLVATEESELAMGPLEDDFLRWYLDAGLWRGKAGACGFQDERLPLELVRGQADNVVGLPLTTIRRLLARLDADRPAQRE